MTTFLPQEKLQNLNSIAHEGKIVVFATDTDGKIFYTVKQDGFEDSYLNTPEAQRTGWETWQTLEFPNEEKNDESVIAQETAELTYQNDTSKFILRSLYQTQNKSAAAPVQLISALGHIYVFRQSKSNTLLVDRFVLDGMTNKLNRKLEVRFKRSKQKHTPTRNMNKGDNGLTNIDTLDFRDVDGNFFYEPTTELCIVRNLDRGWFSVVLVPTIENDVYRWHIFAYNNDPSTKKVELTTIRASAEGLFDVKDYTVFDESNDTLVPRRIPGVIKRTLDIRCVTINNDVTVINGLSATKYDLQQEQQTQSGEMQLIRTATRLMLAVPTNQGTAALSFAIAGDGTLAQIDETPDSTIIRSKQREVLLPLNTLDEIKVFGDRTPPPKGQITGLEVGTDEEDAEDLVKISTNGKASELKNGDLVKITDTKDYQGLYSITKVEKDTFEIDLPVIDLPGVDLPVGTLIFDGMIATYKQDDYGQEQVTVTYNNHGLETWDAVEIIGVVVDDYYTYTRVDKISDSQFTVRCDLREATSVRMVSRKRRGIVFDGVNDYISLPNLNYDFSQGFTVEAWVSYDSFQELSNIIQFTGKLGSTEMVIAFGKMPKTNKLTLFVSKDRTGKPTSGFASNDIKPKPGEWIHLAATFDSSGNIRLYKHGSTLLMPNAQSNESQSFDSTTNYIGKSNSLFKGKISDLRIWNVVRTEEDIRKNMYMQLTDQEVGLVGYWPLDAITEGKVSDLSLNRKHGTVFGDAYVSAATPERKLPVGSWEKQEQESGGLIFDGMITAYEKRANGKLKVTCPDHGLNNGEQVQIVGTEAYNDTYPVQKIDDTNFVIQRKWATGEALKVTGVDEKRRGIVLDGAGDYISLPDMNHDYSKGFTVEAWVWYDSFNTNSTILFFSDEHDDYIHLRSNLKKDLLLDVSVDALTQEGEVKLIQAVTIHAPQVKLETKQWIHLAITMDVYHSGKDSCKVYKNGRQIYSGNIKCPTTLKRTKNYIGKSDLLTDYFNGKISDLRIWTQARTVEDIKNNMYLQLTGKEVGLVGYWRLGAISEGKVIDFSVNGNNGTVFGDAYVSAVTLDRKLAEGTDAVQYSNPELFAVSERANYEESFEFKVTPSTTVNPTYLNNADGKGNKIFTLSYWGKTSRSAEEKTIIAAEQITQKEFEDLKNGWYRASCNVTIPERVSLLRSFEIANIKGNWTTLEIRKHRIRLLSDSITECKYTDTVTLATLADRQATLPAKLQPLELKEKLELVLLKQKQELDIKIHAYDTQAPTTIKIQELDKKIITLESEEKRLSDKYNAENNSPFNYYCHLSVKHEGDNKRVQVVKRNNIYALELHVENNVDWQKFKFIPLGSNFYAMSVKHEGDSKRVQIVNRSYAYTLELHAVNSEDWQKFKVISTESGFYAMSVKAEGDSKRVQVVNRHNIYALELHVVNNVDWQRFKIIRTVEQSNNIITTAYKDWSEKLQQLNTAKKERDELRLALAATAADKTRWDNERRAVINKINDLQSEITSLNNEFIGEVNKIQQTPQTMHLVSKNVKGLVTQGALLGFVQPASRLNAIETSEGNVQLSYFDTEGRMRQTKYDAIADENNAAYEQWIPDANRVCLKFSNSGNVVLLKNDRDQPNPCYLNEDWSIEAWFVYPLPPTTEWNTLTRGENGGHHIRVKNGKNLGIYLENVPPGLEQNFCDTGYNLEVLSQGWHHLTAVGRGDTTLFYIDGKKVGDTKAKPLADADKAFADADKALKAITDGPNTEKYKQAKKTVDDSKKKVDDIKKAVLKVTSDVYSIGNNKNGSEQFGKLAEVRIWGVALSDEEIAVNSQTLLSGNEPGLLAYYPMNEATGVKVRDHSGNGHNGNVSGAIWWGCSAPIGKPESNNISDALISNEYSSVTIENNRKVAIMRRFFAYPDTKGARLLPDKRVEALELKWIGNAQFAPTLLGYIEGAPPVPSENLTLSDDYNSATSVELTMSEDVVFSWKRVQDSGLGANADTFIGSDLEADAGFGFTTKIAKVRAGFKGSFESSYQFQNDSSIGSSSSLSMTDKLELRGTSEETAKFHHLGTRFIPKNVGYALVISALADVFVTRLARSGKMVGYQVQPVDGIPPDVNTITFLINPTYTMNGSLDGLTGSIPTSERFFKHVPEMRSQYGSLYPASYYRLQEAYDLKKQIEAEDKRRESYFSNYDVGTVDELSLDRNIDSGDAPTTIGVLPEENKPDTTPMTEEDKKKAEEEKLKKAQADALATVNEKNAATMQKQAEIDSKISDMEKRAQATDSFAGWQKRMESLQIRAGKRNIVNTYVWDADGGLRTEAQSFANTVEHTIGGSFTMNAGLGFEGKFAGGGFGTELTTQATVNLTQTMSKTENRSKGFQLNVDLGGLEHKGITDHNDKPIMPGEKVDRYRFMSFYLEGSTQNFHDFFNYVVDPEWLASNDEEARALRETQAGKPNKAWRVLHRVTYVERPALMGFGRDVRKLRAAAVVSENQQLLDKIANLEKKNQKLEEKLDKILDLLKAQK
ncbi:LamG domain-containing protein [Microcoleus sp. B9-D4]|uniref:LamG domain-containing protein n=1 Tax=Microcoleus sp. B9-D4 TaxID=2818711 RepID=UPI002FD1ADA1